MNSIYDYYKKQSDRYYVALVLPDQSKNKVQYVWEPMARGIIVPEFDEYDFFVLGKARSLTLYEGLTGLPVIRQSSLTSRHARRCGMEDFRQMMNGVIKQRGGHAAINKAINDFVVGTGQISPRYEDVTTKAESK